MTAGAILTYTLLFVSLYFEVFLLLTFLERRKVPAERVARSTNLPSVAIIVPCYNEQNGIAATLQSLLALEYPRDKFEIIIVDDGSTDRTFEIANTFSSPHLRVFSKENGGKHSA